jgi:hypothetical protein
MAFLAAKGRDKRPAFDALCRDAKRAYPGLVIKCGLAALDRVLDRVQQHVVAEWLRQELDSSRLHGLDRHRHVAETGDQDDRHVNPIHSDALLQIKTIEVRKRNVKYQAARNNDSWARQEFPRRRECLRLPACVADQQFQRFAHRDVVSTTNTIGVARGKGADRDSWSGALDNLMYVSQDASAWRTA